MSRPIVVACMVVVIASRYAAGADSPAATPIATDRPAVTDSSVVVPPWSLQAENGFAETASQGQRTFDVPETLLRFGVASNTELRLTAPGYFWPAGLSSGFGDLAVGLKQQLGPTPGGFDVSLVLSVSLPTGSGAISSHGYDPFVQLPWSRALSSNWTAAGMFSVYWPTVQGRRTVTGEGTFLLDRQIDESLGCVCRIRGRRSGSGRSQAPGAFRNGLQANAPSADRSACWLGPVCGGGGSLHRGRLLFSLASVPPLDSGDSILWHQVHGTGDGVRVYCPPYFLICSAAIFLATSSASLAGTLTSGSTPVPSQFVFEMGFTARANGTPIMK
jgi:hypothetical protein